MKIYNIVFDFLYSPFSSFASVTMSTGPHSNRLRLSCIAILQNIYWGLILKYFVKKIISPIWILVIHMSDKTIKTKLLIYHEGLSFWIYKGIIILYSINDLNACICYSGVYSITLSDYLNKFTLNKSFPIHLSNNNYHGIENIHWNNLS